MLRLAGIGGVSHVLGIRAGQHRLPATGLGNSDSSNYRQYYHNNDITICISG